MTLTQEQMILALGLIPPDYRTLVNRVTATVPGPVVHMGQYQGCYGYAPKRLPSHDKGVNVYGRIVNIDKYLR